MNVLDSPVEALAINPVNLGPLLTAAVSSLWAWLAVVTAAAFSFWRLCPSSKTALPPVAESNTTPYTPTNPVTTSFEGERKEDDIPASSDSTPPTTTSFVDRITKEEEGVLTRGDSFKNRFTVYFQEEEEDEERENGDVNGDHDGDDDVTDDDEMDGGDDEVMKKSERGLTVEIARRDLGWYGYQDRRVIDGSVVRLWGEERESCSSCSSTPRSCRRRSPLTPVALPGSPLAFA